MPGGVFQIKGDKRGFHLFLVAFGQAFLKTTSPRETGTFHKRTKTNTTEQQFRSLCIFSLSYYLSGPGFFFSLKRVAYKLGGTRAMSQKSF